MKAFKWPEYPFRTFVNIVLSILKYLAVSLVFMWLFFWYVSGSSMGLFKFIYTYYVSSHVFMTPVSKDTLFTGALKGIVDSLEEKHSMYLDHKEFTSLLEDTSASYSGVGIVLSKSQDGNLEAMTVIEDQPAYKAGIMSGDVITKIDGEDVSTIPSDEAASRIRGREGSHVVLTVLRKGESRDYDLVREKITLPTVKGKMLTQDIGYIRINQFAENTGKDFGEMYKNLQAQGMKKLVLDLRSNPGGLLNVAQEVGDYIIPKGPIVSVKSRFGLTDVYESKGLEPSIPMTVLIDKGSASASEIIAGAVQDYGVGTIVGTNSYGKGTVQTVMSSFDGEGIKITIAKYHTPKDRIIDGIGIKPDVEIDLRAGEKPSYENQLDSQLQKCLEILETQNK